MFYMGTDKIDVEWIKEEESQEPDSGQLRKECADETEYGKSGVQAEDGVGPEGGVGPEDGTDPEDDMGKERFELLRESGRCYLTCTLKEDCEEEAAMLAHNRPDGYLAVTRKSINGQAKLFFDITGKQSLLRCYEKKKLSYEELAALLLSVKSGLDRVEEYLLSEDGLVLSPAYLYRNMNGRQLYFVYLPSLPGLFAQHIRELARFLMGHVDYGEDLAVELAGQFFRYTEAENFSMTVFLEENRSIFEHSAPEKGQEEQEEKHSETGMPDRDETEFMEKGEEEPLKGRRMVYAGAAAVLIAACALPKLAWLLVPAGICAGVAAGILPGRMGRAQQKLLKKEREVYLFSEEQT